MVVELKRSEFFRRFQKSGSIDDLLDDRVRSEVDKGFLAVKVGDKIFKTKGRKLANSQKVD